MNMVEDFSHDAPSSDANRATDLAMDAMAVGGPCGRGWRRSGGESLPLVWTLLFWKRHILNEK